MLADDPGSGRVSPAAIGLIGCTILLFEILLTRIFSVTMWYHFAFFAISLALFGLAASGAVVAVARRRWSGGSQRARMAGAAVLLAAAIPVCFLIDLELPFVPFDIAGGGAAGLQAQGLFAAKFLVLAVPFFFAGLILAVAFTFHPRQVHTIYFADLVGGGIGCALAVPVLLVVSAPVAVLATSALPLLAAALLYRGAGRRRAALACTVAVYAVLGLSFLAEQRGWARISRVKSYDPQAAQTREPPKIYERWHPVSRVAVFGSEHSGASWGWFYADSRQGARFPPVLEVTNDAGARTFILPAAPAVLLAALFRDDVSDLVYGLTEAPDVLVVGVGGGKDVLSALAFGASSVTGVELNPLMIEVVEESFAEFSGAPYRDPRVRIVIDEGRNYIASRATAYDVIKISVTDTWAASAVGAYALTESYLYTIEAMEAYLEHLEPGGFLTVTRFYPMETVRMVTLAVAALRRQGIAEPRESLLMARNAATMTLIVKRGTLTDGEQAAFRERVAAADLTLIWDGAAGPAEALGDPNLAALDELHRRAAVDPADRLSREVRFDVSPPRDDQPFFFNWSRLHEAREGLYLELASGFALQHGRALRLLFDLLLITAGAALLFVVAPLLLSRSVRLAHVAPAARLGFNSYFLLLGLGYMLVEIPLLQQLVLFLGHPVYSLTVVLATLLIASGLGSLCADRWSVAERGARRVVFPAILLALAAWASLVPAALQAGIGLPIALRVVCAAAAIAPVGFLMGMPFPLGLAQAHRVDPGLVPWGWAVNGAASVAAPALAMMVAIQRGFSTTFLLGTAAYALAGVLFFLVRRAAPSAANA